MDPLVSQIRECFGRVVYSHKTHEKCADIYYERLGKLKIAQIVLSAVTTAALVRVFFEQGKVAAITAAVLSAISLIINAYMKDYDLGGLSQKHADTASKLWEVRESYLSLLTDLEGKTIEGQALVAARSELQDRLAAIHKGAPRTLGKAYRRAQIALQQNEDLTFSTEEIDKFLPSPLRKGKSATSQTPPVTEKSLGETNLPN